MATTGHENESINVGGLKSSLQALKTKYVDSINTDLSSLDSRTDTLEEAVGTGGSVDSRIATAKSEIIGGASSDGNTLKKIEDRVSPLESAVGSGGSVDTRISNAINALDSSASQTAGNDGLSLNIIEVDGKITSISGSIAANTYDSYGSAATEASRAQNAETILQNNIGAEATERANAVSAETSRAQTAEQLLQEQYNALTQSDIIVGALPSSGTKNKIYRVPGTNSYSDYMWNGSSWVLMATYNNAIDNEPTAGSDNLVKSGGVASQLGNSVYDTTPLLRLIQFGYFDVDGNFIYLSSNNYLASNFLRCDDYKEFWGFGGSITSGVVYYDKNLQKISSEKSVDHFYKMYDGTAGWTHYDIDNTNGKVYFRVCADWDIGKIGSNLFLIKREQLSNNINNIKDIFGVLVGEPLMVPLVDTSAYLSLEGSAVRISHTTPITNPEQYFCSDYMPIVPNKKYEFYGYSGDVVGNVCYYDSSKNFISCQTFENITQEIDQYRVRGGRVIFKIPQNATYFRCSASLNRPFYLTQHVSDSLFTGNYTPIIDYIVNSLLHKFPVGGSTIAVTANWNYGKFISKSNVISTHVGYAYTDQILITEDMKKSRIVARGGSNHYVVNYYDENQVFLGGQPLIFYDFEDENIITSSSGLGFVDLDIPANANYIRLCCQKDVDNLVWIAASNYKMDSFTNQNLFNSPKDIGLLKKTKKLAILGDSITWLGGDYCDKGGWTEYFKTKFMFGNIISFARGGATWTNTPNTVYDITENTTDNSDDNVIYNQINRLVSSGYSPDVVIIAAGTNDAWLNENPRGESTAYRRPNVFDKTATDVFETNTSTTILSYDVKTLVNLPDAIRYNVELLIQNFPNVQIILLSPLQTVSTFTSFAQNKRVGDLIEDCAKYMSIPCVRQDKECGIWSIRENVALHDLSDGVHLSGYGAKKVGEYLAARLRAIIHG